MKHKPSHSLIYKTLLAVAAGLLISAGSAYAGPGAHGPNGEHLSEAPIDQTGSSSDTALPRFEAQSETFEVVGQLHMHGAYDKQAEAGELSLLIDRFDTNEPVLKANVEVALGPIKAPATFHEEHGDYAVTDPKLLAKLQEPGAHPLVITIEAEDDSDLLDAKLTTPDSHAHDEVKHSKPWLAFAALAAIVVAAGMVWALKRPQNKGVHA